MALTICADTGKIANEYCTNKTTKYYTVKPPKEETGNWTSDYGDLYGNPPTETCSTHTKPVEVPKEPVEKPNEDNNTTTDDPKPEDNNTTTNDQTTTPTFTSNTYKVKVGNYTYEISDDLIYSVSGEYLEIGDAENTWVTRMAVEEGSFATVENRMSQLESYFEQRGATSESAQKQTINGVEYITIEVSFNGANYLCAYAAVDATHVVYMMIYDLYNEHNYDVLDVLAPTVSSIKYSNTSVGIETSDNMDLSILESFINEG